MLLPEHLVMEGPCWVCVCSLPSPFPALGTGDSIGLQAFNLEQRSKEKTTQESHLPLSSIFSSSAGSRTTRVYSHQIKSTGQGHSDFLSYLSELFIPPNWHEWNMSPVMLVLTFKNTKEIKSALLGPHSSEERSLFICKRVLLVPPQTCSLHSLDIGNKPVAARFYKKQAMEKAHLDFFKSHSQRMENIFF